MDGRTGEIIGVMKDFIFRPLNNKTWPLVFMLDPSKVRFVSIRIQKGNIASTLDFIEKTWKKTVPMFPFNCSFLDADLDRSFREMETRGKLLTTFTFISIFISCLGLLGLASYTAQQRTKEIGIRKVLGSSVTGIMMFLSKDFLTSIALSIIIACPVAWFVMDKWLGGYANRIEIGIFTLVFACIFAAVTAIIAICFQVIKAALANPVDSLRSE